MLLVGLDFALIGNEDSKQNKYINNFCTHYIKKTYIYSYKERSFMQDEHYHNVPTILQQLRTVSYTSDTQNLPFQH